MKHLRQYGQLVIMGASTLVLGLCATFLNPLAASAAPTNCTSSNVGNGREMPLNLPGSSFVAWAASRNGSTDTDGSFYTSVNSGCSDVNVAYIYNSDNRQTGLDAPSQCDHFYIQYTDSADENWQKGYTAGADACAMSGGTAKVVFHNVPNAVHFRVWARPVGVTNEAQVGWIQPYYTIYY